MSDMKSYLLAMGRKTAGAYAPESLSGKGAGGPRAECRSLALSRGP
jgi:hypothetical protein